MKYVAVLTHKQFHTRKPNISLKKKNCHMIHELFGVFFGEKSLTFLTSSARYLR